GGRVPGRGGAAGGGDHQCRRPGRGRDGGGREGGGAAGGGPGGGRGRPAAERGPRPRPGVLRLLAKAQDVSKGVERVAGRAAAVGEARAVRFVVEAAEVDRAAGAESLRVRRLRLCE